MMELVLHRMRREMRSKWLRTACLNVIIAAVCYNATLSILLLQRPLADTGTSLLSELIRQWLANASQLVGYVILFGCLSFYLRHQQLLTVAFRQIHTPV